MKEFCPAGNPPPSLALSPAAGSVSSQEHSLGATLLGPEATALSYGGGEAKLLRCVKILHPAQEVPGWGAGNSLFERVGGYFFCGNEELTVSRQAGQAPGV